MAMSGNTRRKVRTGEKKGVTIREGTVSDLDTLYALYQTTGQRDEFLIRPLTYYRQAWEAFMRAGLAHALIAEFERQPIAHVILFHFGRKCWYFYGRRCAGPKRRVTPPMTCGARQMSSMSLTPCGESTSSSAAFAAR